jgi:hypothetical protein
LAGEQVDLVVLKRECLQAAGELDPSALAPQHGEHRLDVRARAGEKIVVQDVPAIDDGQETERVPPSQARFSPYWLSFSTPYLDPASTSAGLAPTSESVVARRWRRRAEALEALALCRANRGGRAPLSRMAGRGPGESPINPFWTMFPT